jgi:hypothetical protein
VTIPTIKLLDADAPPNDPVLMETMKSCLKLIASMDQPSAQRALTVVSFLATNIVCNLDWASLTDRDLAIEAFIENVREGIALLDKYDREHAGHG